MNTKKPTILLVDDEAIILQSLASFLEEDYELLIAKSGTSALKISRSKQPDLILLDISMPDMDGFEVMRTLKEDPQTSSIPIIFLTAHSDSDTILHALRSGADDFTFKPINPTVVQKRIANTLEKSKANELLKLQEKLLAQQAEFAQKGEILSMIAHQWRQPLSSIANYFDLITMHFDLGTATQKNINPLSVKGKELVIELSKTLEQFNSLKNPRENMVKLNSESFFKDFIAYFTRNLTTNTIQFSLDPSSDASFTCCKEQAILLLNKIYLNSFEAIKENQIQNGEIVLKLTSDSEKTTIEVSDNGGGVKEADLPHLCDPYYSTKSLNKRGLGLYTVKKSVEDPLRGSFECKNIENGLECTIVIPL